MGTTATITATMTSRIRSTRNIRSRVYLTIALVAVLAWGTAFLAPGSRFWDDWVVDHEILKSAQEAGQPWAGYVIVALSAIGIWAFKVVALGTTIVVGWMTYEISGRSLGLRPRERLLLAMLMVALPLNTARMIAVLDIYAWSLALFFVAWYLLVSKSPSSPGRARYVVATLIFLVSYGTGSLLLFTLLPIAHLAYLALSRNVPLWQGALRFALRFWYLFLAPVVFWVVRTLFLQPYGLYKGYNRIGLAGGLSNPDTVDALALSATLVFVVLVVASWLFARATSHARIARRLSLGALAATTGGMGYFLLENRASAAYTARVIPVTLLLCALILLATAIFPIGHSRSPDDDMRIESGDRAVTPLLAVALVALILAILPYLLVGKLPSFHQWETRHQLLMPLGVAIIIVATMRALSGIFPLSAVRLVALGLVTVFTFVSLTVSLKLVADWRKQAQVIEALAKDPLVRRASIVVFSDRAPRLNYDARGFNFYEYTGWLDEAFGTESRLGIDRTSVPSFLRGDFQHFQDAASRYGFAEYRKPTHGVLIQIIPIEGASWWTLLAGEPGVSLRVTPIASWTKLAAESRSASAPPVPTGTG